MGFHLTTKNGYSFFDCASAMQKGIRRCDVPVAGFFALELWESGFTDYVWKRLLTISAEDCYGIITGEIESLYRSHEFVRKGKKEPKGRIFVSKAVILLCYVRKNRDADHLQNFIYDQRLIDIAKWLEDSQKDPIPVPEYTFDVHTKKGRSMGKTKAEFFREEFEALNPREPGLFDQLITDVELLKEKS